ncbi:hypothetical protein EVAR_88255_1 [Eumeta japonica]|uniref:Uncharacterized protein n=1 Tax=Eumeta variegata TaxID=151549 RepID=A0A4C1XMH7_EUMVA|nr:hypothetical protein EVAR_88255_1 [Eumeta japonica]
MLVIDSGIGIAPRPETPITVMVEREYTRIKEVHSVFCGRMRGRKFVLNKNDFFTSAQSLTMFIQNIYHPKSTSLGFDVSFVVSFVGHPWPLVSGRRCGTEDLLLRHARASSRRRYDPDGSNGDDPLSGVQSVEFPELAGDLEVSVDSPSSSLTVTAGSGRHVETRTCGGRRPGRGAGDGNADKYLNISRAYRAGPGALRTIPLSATAGHALRHPAGFAGLRR